ncbi:hypothetical protein M404DRAFT_995869 [Pisolithus tinctorius Marx 270]|uniref:Uncharacterized protein n=1 Tax=Pisolithus tinctorius Marx 270 TaxID=870435 RepID=A0A0C3P8T5_PISTI|nr:hypothetical protein M404DRAFT_995869 [Pisolithus tinctorius Marx 270]
MEERWRRRQATQLESRRVAASSQRHPRHRPTQLGLTSDSRVLHRPMSDGRPTA